MAKQSASTKNINKPGNKTVEMKQASETKTPAAEKKRTTNKLFDIRNEEQRELASSSPKTRLIKRRLSQLKTPLAPMKMLLMKPPKIKGNKIQSPDVQKEKSRENEGSDDEVKKTKKEKSSKRDATKK
ncbi:hypothetical protein AgCh_036139 [Apium graveolens]